MNVSDAQKNSALRTKKAKKNILVMFLIKGIGLVISFLYIPLLLNTLETVEYGVWLTLTSIVSWISFFDIGLGNGLRNKLSAALASNSYQEGKELVSTAYCCIVVLVIILCILFLTFYPFVHWNDILNANGYINGLNLLVLVVFVSFFVNFGLTLINSILYAAQKPAISSGLITLSQLVSYLVVLLLTRIYNVSSLLILGITISTIPTLVSFVASLILFHTSFSNISPSIKFYRKQHVKGIFSLGIQFFILQIVTLILFYANNIIITHVVGNQAVVEYNITYKYIHVLTMIFTIIATPIWSATTEAYTMGETDWIKAINKKLLRIGTYLISFGVIMVLAYPIAFKLWLGDNCMDGEYTILTLLLLQSAFTILYGCYGYILNGMGKLKIQLIATSVLAILYIPSAVILGGYFGLKGILLAFAMNAIINYLWSKMQYNKIINNKAKGLWAK